MNHKIYRDSRIPLYVQIITQLRTMIGERRPGEKFFSEGDLAKLFQVSKMTIRQAVQEVVDEGLLRRVRGIGTFVGSAKIEQKLDRVRDFADAWLWQGAIPKVRILNFTQQPCPGDMAASISVQPGDSILFVQRLRYANETPVVLDYRFFPQSIGCQLTEQDLRDHSIRKTVTEKLHIPVAGQEMQIWADRIGAEDAKILEIKEGDPVLVRKNIFYTSNKGPIWSGRSYFRCDMYQYSVYVPA